MAPNRLRGFKGPSGAWGCVTLLCGVLLAAGAHPARAGVNVWTTHGPWGAYVEALAIDPHTPSTLYAATFRGSYGDLTSRRGLYRSTDSGSTWNQTNFPGWPIFDPTTPSTLYVRSDDGVLRSTDSGASWDTVLPITGVTAVALDPKTPSTLYAGTNEAGGVFKSTDSGANWTPVNTGLPLDVAVSRITALAIDPDTPSTLYMAASPVCAGMPPSCSGVGGVFKSTDSGGTWSAASTGLTDISGLEALAIDPHTPSTLYVVVSGGVFQSTDSGSTWNQTAFPGLPVFDPQTVSTLYALAGGRLYQTINSGASWSAIFTGVNVLAIDPDTPTTLYIGTNSGVSRSTDSGASWRAANTGLAELGVSALAVNPQPPGTLYAGTSTGVFKSTDSGASWSNVDLSYVTALAINPSTPSTLYAVSNGGVFQSTDSGGSWTAVNTGLPPFNPAVTALAIDPTTPSTLYAVVGALYTPSGVNAYGVYRSTNDGHSWYAVNAGLVGDSGNTLWVTALAIDPTTPSTLYAATYDGFGSYDAGVYKSIDRGTSWTATAYLGRGYGSLPPGRLVIDPHTPTTLYVEWGGIYRSTDSGSTWDITAFPGLPAFDPQTPSILYAGTNGGVFKSTDSGGTWTAVNTGLADTDVTALAIDPTAPTTLYAGSDTVYDIEQVPPTTTPTATVTATPTPSATASPTLTRTPSQPPTNTPTETPMAGGSGGGGCTITSGHNNGGAWWLFVGALAFACRRRAGRKP